MHGDSDTQNGEQGLGSWHPAHMPNSNPAQETNTQLRNDAVNISMRSADLDSSSPRYIPPNDSSLQYLQESNPSPGSHNDDQSHDHGNLSGDNDATQAWNHVDDGNEVECASADAFCEDSRSKDRPDTNAINGLSFISHPTPENRDSSQEVEAGHVSGAGDPYKDFNLQEGGSLLPAFGALNRSNSFPAVPPLHQTHGLNSQSHTQTQVEKILEEDEETGNIAQIMTHASDEQQTVKAEGSDADFFGTAVGNGDNGFSTHGLAEEDADISFSPVDEEARFEEGLPLMQSEPSENGQAQTSKELSLEILNEFSTDMVPDFFAEDTESPDEASFFKPPPLDRKSTNQVLDSLSLSPHNSRYDESDPQKSRPSLEDISGGGIAVSSSTVVSQVVAEQLQSTENLTPPTSQKDEDLSAMWQAALDDDELLDDSELPSTEAVQATLDLKLVSPELQPVYSVDGRMQGFENPKAESRNDPASAQNRYSPVPNHGQMGPPANPNPMPLAGQQFQAPSMYSLSHSSSAPAGFGQPSAWYQSQSNEQRPPRPGMPKPAQSFADKSKGGYTSPYDLPMDVNRPKRRTNLQQVQNASSSRPSQPPPPPRSTSMYASGIPTDDSSPPLPPLPHASPSIPATRPTSSNVRAKPSIGSFFEELPSTKSRPSSSAGRYAPSAPQYQPGQLPPRPDPPRQPPSTQRPGLTSANTSPDYQLVPSERHSPYASLPQQDRTSNGPLQANPNSPAPGSQSNLPPLRNRYAGSPAATSRQPASTTVMPFQPRTSSPLAHHSSLQQQPYYSEVPDRPQPPPRHMTTRQSSQEHPPVLPQVAEHSEHGIRQDVPAKASDGPTQKPPFSSDQLPHPPNSGPYGAYRNSPSDSGTTALAPNSDFASITPDQHMQHPTRPQVQSQPEISPQDFEPPRRSQTSSPGAARPKLEALGRIQATHQRPASAIGGVSQIYAEFSAPSSYVSPAPTGINSRPDLHYIQPSDGREHDPLERWKGAPIFKFGFGGAVVTSFPKQIPRYTAGHAFPMVKCSPGEVKLQSGNVGTLDDHIPQFSGPLKNKSKKKELLTWLQQKINALEKAQSSVFPSSLLPDPIKRHEEKLLLWKVMQVMVEYDGVVTRSSKAETAVRAVLCPEAGESDGTDSMSSLSREVPSAISKTDGAQPVAEPTDPAAMESIRRLLLRGEREKAVWQAVDRRMWAHAMVLASTLEKSVWKQVLHEFTRLEVRPFGNNSESLAALYEVFAGNWEESIDELVPPSARAGLQMVSKVTSAGPTRNALDGLDKWRETLTLILSNRTTDDESALVALGHLLGGYGRVEAAHVCLLFANSTGLFGGSEESRASIALLGADQKQQPFDYGRDLDSILLTEIHEFTRSVLAPSASLSSLPHLQCYKLYHAVLLAEHGYRSEAQQYCDAIMNTLKSTTKPSPYYHSILFNALDDLMERLQQAPRDSSSWMSKPMDKVSGSMWKKLNNFIVGDESDTASVASGKGDQDAGPFARVAAEPSSISRGGSSTDLYGAYINQPGLPAPPATTFGSRYAPGGHYANATSGLYTPRSSLEQQGRSSDDLPRPSQPNMLQPSQSQQPYIPNQPRYSSSPAKLQDIPSQQYKPIYQSSPYESPQPGTYLPTPPAQPDYPPTVPTDSPSSSLYPQDPYQPHLASPPQASQNHVPSLDVDSSSTYDAPPSTYEPTTSYEPPSAYTPYDAEGRDDLSPAEQRSPKKKKSFMYDDDDDDFDVRAAATLKAEKARKDKEADDAFRKAAEADAHKDQQLKTKKSGWFGGVGGWLGGGKKEDANLNQEQPKAIKAKLGEESSFYYDKELKKWVNKKGPPPAAAEAPKAPPPRGPPSRAVSAAGRPPAAASGTATPPVPPLPSIIPGEMGMPPINVSQATLPTMGFGSGPPSRVDTPARTASPALSMPAAATAGGGEANGPPSAPPSRPATAAGGPGKSDIDDLLGEPQVRKGGTMRRGKKGRGYVDVMAK
ncbi:MAG: hypothetical protein LQ350_003771 [Teloschistes chrysophthalmus]|nr:MAG: hypothetical protein LQ350_003771 [Niorma chrysophthalma]